MILGQSNSVGIPERPTYKKGKFFGSISVRMVLFSLLNGSNHANFCDHILFD